MTVNEANQLINHPVTFWDDDSQSYIEGTLIEVDEEYDESRIRVGVRVYVVNLDNVHSGYVEEVDASYMAPEDGEEFEVNDSNTYASLDDIEFDENGD